MPARCTGVLGGDSGGAPAAPDERLQSRGLGPAGRRVPHASDRGGWGRAAAANNRHATC